MKLSLAWIFDHIIGSPEIVIDELVEKFNKTTAEISSYKLLKLDLNNIFFVQVTKINNQEIQVFCPETRETYCLPNRTDIQLNMHYLMIKDKQPTWVTMKHLGSDKEMLLGAIFFNADIEKGSWRNIIKPYDYILDIDNKSITHRPDLWSHRGVAREVAAIFNLTLVPEQDLLLNIPVVTYEHVSSLHTMPYLIENKTPQICKRFAVCYLPDMQYQPSILFYAFRLACIDARPINAIVDAINYTMFDIGQPLHGFDAQKITTKRLVIEKAQHHTLILLDGTNIALTSDDLIISDGKHPLSLAGIMGGIESAISSNTNHMLLESAHFQGSSIRKSALHHKKRTESSTRFEKNLDPMLNVIGLKRCLFLLQQAHVLKKIPDDIISLGDTVLAQTIDISHDVIEQKIGSTISDEFIIATLTKLDFDVHRHMQHKNILYHIMVPTFRLSKDGLYEADMVEEIVRFYGFDNISKVLPIFAKKGQTIIPALHQHILKNILAFGWHGHEVNNYAFYDEDFLHKLSWQPKHSLNMINPVSTNAYRLVTSLIPNLLKNISINSAEYVRLRLFEWNRIWLHKKDIQEEHMIAGISYAKRDGIDFYAEKNELTSIFDALGLKEITWQKPEEQTDPWWDTYQTADLYYKDHYIGRAGNADGSFLSQFIEGHAFIFQCDVQKLLALSYNHEKKFTPLSKFPHTSFDISMFVPLTLTFDQIKKCIYQTDSRIEQVSLIDYFQKDEWLDKKSITVHCIVRDMHKTLQKEEIDALYKKVLQNLQLFDVEIR